MYRKRGYRVENPAEIAYNTGENTSIRGPQRPVTEGGNPMRRTVLGVCVLFVSAACFGAGEIGFEEDFALATDRTVPLKQLIPGTEDYYFYHCLHYQNTGRLDEVDKMLVSWIRRYKRTARVVEIENRQALLKYGQDPVGSLAYLRRTLGLQFNHRKEVLGRKPNLPTRLDQGKISRATLTRRALSRHSTTLRGFEDAALDWLITTQLSGDRRRALLRRLKRPDHKNLPRVVVDDLNYKYSRGFGSMNIHRQMLLTQLDECLRLKPDLLQNSNFVNTYLTKLQPNPDVDWKHDDAACEAYYNRLWRFVSRLAPSFNSLKANVLYRRLRLDRRRGIYDKDRFMEYLKLPRPMHYVERKYLDRVENRRHRVNLTANYRRYAQIEPIRNDEQLVRSYFAHFFLTENDYKPYATWVNDVYLKHLFAETKILAGVGDMEKWYSMLPPAQYKALKERVDIDFAYTNRRLFAPADDVKLDVYTKNVKKLLVKVFEINTVNYYRDLGREVNTDINLDGLVANEERVNNYTDVALRRVKRTFTFPKLKQRGVYVVEFIGNGKSSRALIRKGKFRHLVRTSTAGHVFTVLDEQNRKINDATLWIAGHEYAPEKDGTVTVPFSNRPRSQSMIIRRGDFASLSSFRHDSENYQLAAGLYVDRESLLSRRKATLIVRPALYLNNVPVTLSVLEEVELMITSVDRDGVQTTKKIAAFKLHEDRESTVAFQVPENLTRLGFQLRAKVQNLSQNKKVNLSTQRVYSLNSIDRTEKVEDLHLRHVGGNYFLDLLGKTGEPKVDRPVNVVLKHREFTEAVHVSLQTDKAGTVALGALGGIARVSATGPEGTTQNWNILRDLASFPDALHGREGEALAVPYMGSEKQPAASALSLLEKRGGTFVADRFASLSIKDGLLVLSNLPRGDYDLLIKPSKTRIVVRVAKGRSELGYVLGDNRQLERKATKPLQIAEVAVQGENVRIRLVNVLPKFTRVQVVATRYMPEYSVAAELGKIRFPGLYALTPPKLDSLYKAGRKIGDEYRYILERKYARIFPGNMLKRPELLLNPWAIRKTATGEQVARPGAVWGRGAREGRLRGGKGGGAYLDALQRARGTVSSNLDFLGDTAAVLTNLKPDAAGVVTVKRADLGAHQHLHVVAVDPQNTVYRVVSLPEVKTRTLDLTLANALDAAKHFTEQKRVSVVNANVPFILFNVRTSKFETYDTLAKVYTLYVTLSGNSNLREFAFILNWPKMKPEEKQKMYSKYACHELNFFIARKDKTFFETVVQPYLRNKKDKTFLDHYLTGANLSSYLKPWNYAQLNIVERALLGRRIVAEHPAAARHVKDLFDLLPPDVERFNHLFKTALKGSALDVPTTPLALAPAEDRPAVRYRRAGRALGAPVATGAAAAKPQAPGRSREMAKAEAEKKALAYDAERLRDQGKARKQVDALERLEEDATYFKADEARRKRVRQYYRKLDKTQEWVENNYYHLPIEQQNASLVKVNAFWRDFAAHDGRTPFFSTHLADASRSFTEMMFALSVLDVPFEAKKHKSDLQGAKLTLTPGSPAIVYHKEIKEAQAVEQTPILVSQNFFRYGDRYIHKGGERFDKFVTDEFLRYVVYGCQVVITNPTSSRQKLDVLLQIPKGAMPVRNGFYTKGRHVQLEPYRTTTIEYHFYFPDTGKFPQYPVHVAKNEKLIGFGKPATLNVVEKPSRVDTTSWDYLSQHGTLAQVMQFLNRENINRINLGRIAWRVQDLGVFKTVIPLLQRRHLYNHTLWSYGIKHNDPAAIREYLQHANAFVSRCGSYIDTTLLKIDPVIRKSYQHMEYSPLVNARAHRLGQKRKIVNDRFYAQYQRLMTVLRYRPKLDDDDLMAVTYYMLLQDRVAEGAGFFTRVNPARLATKIQYDYAKAYMDFFTDKPTLARAIATKYQKHGVDRWRNAFTAMLAQLDEIEGKAAKVVDKEDRTQVQTKLAATQASFDFKVEEKKVTINYQNVKAVKVNYYLMDIELLFSRNPFVQAYSGQFAYIRPNATAAVPLPAGATKHVFMLPAKFHSSNVMVEISAAGIKKSRAYFSNALAVQVIENYGQVKVTHQTTAKPLPKVYVKAYARMKTGGVKFYKDGYTDLRGRFDYTSLNTNELDNVEKFSLLILSKEYGAVVREASPPKR